MAIIVKKQDGSSFPLVSSANKSIITQGEQKVDLLGEDVVTMNVVSATPLKFDIGDTVEIYGAVYTMNALPEMTKRGNRVFAYNLVFEGIQYELLKAQYLDLDSQGLALSGDFSIMLTLKAFFEMLIRNANRAQPNKWVLGQCPDTDSRNMSFSDENCLSALQRVCQEFGYEFWITYNSGKYTINIGTVGSDLPHSFAYGRGKGLYELTRQSVDSQNIVTRLYAFGADKNLKSSYRGHSKRLKLPNAEYLEDAQAKINFGTIEATKNWDDIYPRRKGVVTALGGNVNTFIDATMDFDLNEKDAEGNTKWLIAGTSAKISFSSGNLAGYDFDIQSYDNTTKMFVILPFEDERGQQFPDKDAAAFQFAVGDNYVIYDIVMPDQYVTNAENELLEAATEYLSQNKYPRVSYKCVLDELYLKRTAGSGTVNNVFSVGDYVTVVDSSMNVDGTVRIQGFVRDVVKPYKYSLTLSDYVQITRIERLISDNTDIKRIIYVNKLNNPERTRENWRTVQEMLDMIFDTDGYFDPDNIRPLSVETSMLAVGAKPEQFTTDVIIEPNYDGNPNLVNITGGTLVHLTIEENPRTWYIQSGQITLDSPSTAYYIYLRCFRETGNTDGLVYITTDQIKVDQDPTYYHFLMGVLHSVSSQNVRWITLSYGSTSINGRFIKTGRIQSADGKTWFDLDTGEISGRIQFIGSGGTPIDVEDAFEYLQNEIDNLIIEGGGSLNFLTEPNQVPMPPYNRGDTWSNKIDLRICVNSKPEGGIYEATDWILSTSYDNTRTIIDGGIVTSGTIQLAGDEGNILAGITGNGTESGSVRIWAGADYANRATAPFRVTQDGSLYADKAYVKGVIIADSGTFNNVNIQSGAIGGFTIASGRIGVEGMEVYGMSLQSGYIKFSDQYRFSCIGTETLSAFFPVARFENTENRSPANPNHGIDINVSGANENYALYIASGDIKFGNYYSGKINIDKETPGIGFSNTNLYINGKPVALNPYSPNPAYYELLVLRQ